MKQLYALLLCITIACVNPALYAMDDTSNNRNTAVLHALKKNKPYEHIKKLLEQRADPNGIQGDLQNNPLAYLLDCFSTENKYAIAKLLLEHGADPNALPYIAITAAKCDSEMFDLLLKNGMKLDAYESVGGKGTPLTEVIAHLRGYACLERVLKLIKSGAPVQDGCALLEAAAQGREDIVGMLFVHKCPPDAWVKKYYSHTGAMDCTRDEGKAHNLYLEFLRGWHLNSLPRKHKRISVMFEKAQSNSESFVYCPRIMQLFDAAPQFPVIKTDACICTAIDLSNSQNPADCKIMADLDEFAQEVAKGNYSGEQKHELAQKYVKNMSFGTASTCLMHKVLSMGIFRQNEHQDMFCKMLDEQPHVAFTGHKSRKYPNKRSNILMRIIKKACERKHERCEHQILFEKLFALKPQEWQPSWHHMAAALKAAQLEVPYYLEMLLPYCDINAYGPDGQTLLHVLLTDEHVHAGIVKKLIDAGANPNLPDMSHGGNTALQLALNKKYWDFINEYNDGEGSGNENSDDESAYVSPKDIKRKVITLLVNHGADIKQPNLYGQTAEDSMREYGAQLEMHLLAVEVLSEVTQQLQLSESSAQKEPKEITTYL